MSVFTTEISQQIVETCRENTAAIVQPLNSSFGTNLEANVGELLSGANVATERIGDAAGIAVTFQFGDEGAVCLIPESLPIPDWYRSPSEGQANQLQTIGMEWSVGLFPLDLETTGFGSAATQSLKQQFEKLAPVDDASVLEVQLRLPDSDEPTCSLLLVWPVTNPVLESVAPWPAPEQPAAMTPPQPASSARSTPPAVQKPEKSSAATLGVRHSGRVLKVPVDLTVRIASKKVDVNQVRNITPGTLITFNKTCESLLDVFVADKLKFRGEAVKVGERFGIKINEADAKVVREQRVHRI
ncbi:hypothetical protein GC176_18195 [bacterium]|nr:hypothetical protein [bacterium]